MLSTTIQFATKPAPFNAARTKTEGNQVVGSHAFKYPWPGNARNHLVTTAIKKRILSVFQGKYFTATEFYG
jgi:hypothetical protein